MSEAHWRLKNAKAWLLFRQEELAIARRNHEDPAILKWRERLVCNAIDTVARAQNEFRAHCRGWAA